MTPKERAKGLIQTFRYYDANGVNLAKELSKRCVKEITTELNKLPSKDLSDLQYWYEVDYEISLL